MITWDGVEDGSSRVEILDLSRNGTFVSLSSMRCSSTVLTRLVIAFQVNGTKLGKDAYIKLKDGDRVAFGSTMRPPSASTAIRGYEDNRECSSQRHISHLCLELVLGYVFYHTACKMSISATPASP